MQYSADFQFEIGECCELKALGINARGKFKSLFTVDHTKRIKLSNEEI